MPLQSLTPPPPAPQRTDNAEDFVSKADTFVAWYATFVAEMTTLTAELMATTALVNVAPAYSDTGLRVMTGKVPAADRFIYFNGTSTSALATLSAFGRSLIDDASASAALTTLGVTTFAQTLLDDANASTALSTLGVSTYAKTLLDDADASTALTTLGVSAYVKTLLDDADAPAARVTLGVGPFSQQGNNAQIGTNGTVGYIMDAAQVSHFAAATLPGSGRIRVGATAGYGIGIFNASNYNAMQFTREVSGAVQEKGTIYVTDTGTSYNTTSDKTHKTDNGLLTAAQAWAILRLIEIHNYTWIDSGKDDIGPFAQDLYEVYPNGVTPGGWFDDDGQPAHVAVIDAKYRPWSVDHSKLMPLVVTALQNLDQRIAALEATAA